MSGRTVSDATGAPPSENAMVPAVGRSSPTRSRNSVVLPAPSGPISPWRRPGRKPAVTPRSARVARRVFSTPVTSIPTAAIPPPPSPSTGEPDLDGHPGLQDPVLVREDDLDAV